ncbi:carph-isopro domain-containing protein [Dactylosporangium sp. NPDC006015]|uniref:carph-isopro domain-containing protein n=1 Tax=unclassified Dactylosporangium TaxID=2621675 RepID=UPI00339DC3CB
MPAPSDRTNPALAARLSEAGLTPRALARELNRLLGVGTLAETAPYYWRDAGGVPRTPLPALTAYVVSRRLGKIVTASDLWPGRSEVGDGTLILDASAGMTGPWSLTSTMLIAEDWLLGGLMDRRMFLSVSGAALTRAVGIYLDTQGGEAPTTLPAAASVDDPLVDQIEEIVPRLQVLDDEQGGGTGLNYVDAQMRAVLLVLRDGAHSDGVRRRLLYAVADLAQLAGWKAIDAARPGLAQRYLFTGLRAAHEAGYRAMEAHILADLSFQAASLGDTSDGVALGEAARRISERSAESVRASVQSRLSYAYAAAGRLDDCERSWKRSHDHLAQRQVERDPPWMYYLTANHLDCQAGYAMVLAGRQSVAAGDGASGRAQLRHGAALLRKGAYARKPDLPYQRRALYEGAWLALAYTAHGKLDDACEVTELALPRLDRVRSPRSTALLGVLATELRRRKRNHTVADLLPKLETALSNQAVQRLTSLS